MRVDPSPGIPQHGAESDLEINHSGRHRAEAALSPSASGSSANGRRHSGAVSRASSRQKQKCLGETGVSDRQRILQQHDSEAARCLDDDQHERSHASQRSQARDSLNQNVQPGQSSGITVDATRRWLCS